MVTVKSLSSTRRGPMVVLDPHRPFPLEKPAGCVCALFTMLDGQVLGLCQHGALVCWDLDTGRPSWVLKGPGLAARPLWTRLVHWPEQDALVWSAAGGQLVTCRTDPPELKVQYIGQA